MKCVNSQAKLKVIQIFIALTNYILKAHIYVIEADVTFLVGKKMLENCEWRLGTRKSILETYIKGDQKDCNMIVYRIIRYYTFKKVLWLVPIQ